MIITILDEFLDDLAEGIDDKKEERSSRGLLAEYADPTLQKNEKSAWEKAVIEKYGND